MHCSASMHCAGCKSGMEALTLVSHIGTSLTIDVCWPCHLIWFDHLESTSLSPASVIELFKRIHEARDAERNLVSLTMRCPACDGGLKLTHDVSKSGRFSYYRCEAGDGRITSFTQFLREKNFIRSLSAAEIRTLSVQVKQIRCSSCGGSIDLEHDTACSHCGSAISVLDRDAVEKALAALTAKAIMQPVGPSLSSTAESGVIDALLQRSRAASSGINAYTSRSGQLSNPTYDWLADAASWGQSADLVSAGISDLVESLFDS